MDDGTFESWEERIDWALGQAGCVLQNATKRFLDRSLTEEDAESATVLAEAWRDLATQWRERIEEESVPENEDEDVVV